MDSLERLILIALLSIVIGSVAGFLIHCYLEKGEKKILPTVIKSSKCIIILTLFWLLMPVRVLFSKDARKQLIEIIIQNRLKNYAEEYTEIKLDKGMQEGLKEILMARSTRYELFRFSLKLAYGYFNNFIDMSVLIIRAVVKVPETEQVSTNKIIFSNCQNGFSKFPKYSKYFSHSMFWNL